MNGGSYVVRISVRYPVLPVITIVDFECILLPPMSQTKSPVPRLPDSLKSCLLHMPFIAPAPMSNISFCTESSRHIVMRFGWWVARSDDALHLPQAGLQLGIVLRERR